MFRRPTLEIDCPHTYWRGGSYEITNPNADEYAGEGNLPEWFCYRSDTNCLARSLCWSKWYEYDGKPNCDELKEKSSGKQAV